MATKRGRPRSLVSGDDDAARFHQRRLAYQREQYRRTRGRPTKPTAAQLAQGERIIQFFDETDAAETLMSLGLRVEDLDLPQDPTAIRDMASAVPVEEQSLYSQPTLNHPIASRETATQTLGTRSLPLPIISRTHTTESLGNDNTIPILSPLPHRSVRRAFQLLEEVDLDLEEQEQPVRGGSRLRAERTPPTLGGVSNGDQTETSNREARPPDNPLKYPLNQFDALELPTFQEDDDINIGSEAGTLNPSPFIDPTSPPPETVPTTPQGSPELGSWAPPSRVSHCDEDTRARDYTLEKIYQQLREGLHGCSPEEHTRAREQHNAAVGENHHGLDEVFNDIDFPSTLDSEKIMALPQITEQVGGIPPARVWEATFCGFRPQQGDNEPHHVCLHKDDSEAQPTKPIAAFDVDSYLGFASSLAVARRGIRYQPAPQYSQNLTNDVHFRMDAYPDADRPDRAVHTMPRDIPHFLLGWIEGAHHMPIYILFPHLPFQGNKFSALSDRQLQRWYDLVFVPALYDTYEADYLQHLPSTFDLARANSRAAQVEGRLVDGRGYQSLLSMSYFLQPESLGEVWDRLLDNIGSTDGLHDFRDPQLLFAAKNTKLQFKTRTPSLLDAMTRFRTHFRELLDPAYLDHNRVYIDIAREDCPPDSSHPRQELLPDQEPQVYLLKRCCLAQCLRWLYDGNPPRHGHRIFYQNMLYDAATMNHSPPPKSQLRLGGLAFVQAYNSIKEVVDCAKHFPFRNDGLEELALDPKIQQAARSIAGSNARDRRIVHNAYCGSKRRMKVALDSALHMSFGVRAEFRVSWSLFEALETRLRNEMSGNLAIYPTTAPPSVWAVPTLTFVPFLRRQVDKFTTGFEMALGRCQPGYVTWEQTKIMAMFLRLLRFCINAEPLRQESSLWWHRRRGKHQDWIGLGFSRTLVTYGYCWLEPRVDWDHLVFKPDVTEFVMFGNDALRKRYLRRGGQVKDFFTTTDRLDLALAWLRTHHHLPLVRNRLLLWCAHLCLQQYRIDAFVTMHKDFAPAHVKVALKGQEPLCYEYIARIMTAEPYLVNSARVSCRNPEHLFQWLFDSRDDRARGKWDRRPFRLLYQRLQRGLEAMENGNYLRKLVHAALRACLFTYHWVLPLPSSTLLTQTVAPSRQRAWYSISVDGPVYGVDENFKLIFDLIGILQLQPDAKGLDILVF
jgi:hypothetical protein